MRRLLWRLGVLPPTTEEEFQIDLANLEAAQEKLRRKILVKLEADLRGWPAEVAKRHAVNQPEVTLQLGDRVAELKQGVQDVAAGIRSELEVIVTRGAIKAVGSSLHYQENRSRSRDTDYVVTGLPELTKTVSDLKAILEKFGYQPKEVSHGISLVYKNSHYFLSFYHLTERVSYILTRRRLLEQQKKVDQATRIWRKN